MKSINTVSFAFCATMVAGCAVGDGPEQVSSTTGDTWEQFLAKTYRENWAGGHFIVNGDTPIVDEKALHEFYDSLQQGGLIVNTVGGNDDKWNDTQKMNLTYCISNNFGSNKPAIVAAMDAATAGWESRGNVDYTYVSAEDASCDASNQNVVFDVGQVTGQPYLARAFFPSNSRSSRNVLVDTSSFGDVGWPLDHILGHELGHTLGFRHEHTRPEAGTCFEDDNWRPLTTYDSASIMHYPQCNGSSQDLNWTARDAEGVVALYGEPGGGGGGGGGGGTEHTETATGSVAEGGWYSPQTVLEGTTFSVTMTGSGDPDLYVRWGSAPTTSSYNCRPYIDGPSESCSMTVPAGETKAYIGVNGFTDASFDLSVTYSSP